MKQNKIKIRFLITFVICLFLNLLVDAQNDVMMQAFYWDVPVNSAKLDGTWWDKLTSKADELKSTGYTGVWVPPPSKGSIGIYDMGYGIYDHYDLGNYNQRGSVETRFGSKIELKNMLDKMHQSPRIEVYADIVLNHIYGNEEELENNPAVKQYVFDCAVRNGIQFAPYQVNDIEWVIPNAAPGDYYIQIKGYCLNWNDIQQRGYDIYIDWTGINSSTEPTWEYEPNNGNGSYNIFPGSGQTVRANIDYQTDIDEYKVTVKTTHDILIILTAKQEKMNNNKWEWVNADDQRRGYYPAAVWYNGINITDTALQARTCSGIKYVLHTENEPNYSWDYSYFHPVDKFDYLEWPGNDEMIPNSRFFGNDLNTFNPEVQKRLIDWGAWLTDQIGFDGFRLDFVRGFQESFTADWIKNLSKVNGSQRFIVGEYWGGEYRIKEWVNKLSGLGAYAHAFDFPLKGTLTAMCNNKPEDFMMYWLNHAGLVRNNSQNSLPGTFVVTFIENHDTGKEPDKWIKKDFKMAYAYTLTHEGRPCVFYPHYFGITLKAMGNDESVKIPSGLKDDIRKLIFIRKTYLDGIISVLSEVGNPYPSDDTKNVYVARRQGNSTKDGAIIVINNHRSQKKGLWVDSSPQDFSNWAGLQLQNALIPSQKTKVSNDGRVYVYAPPRGYAIWVKQSDYTPYKK